MNTKWQSWVRALGEHFKEKKWTLATVESCTGGELASAITSVEGSSLWFDRGWITYSNESKNEQLGVDRDLLLYDGAVSEACVRAMVEGGLQHSRADVAVAITGIAGPTGGSEHKPIGTVWIAWAVRSQRTVSRLFRFRGSRLQVRSQAVEHALEGLNAICTHRQRKPLDSV